MTTVFVVIITAGVLLLILHVCCTHSYNTGLQAGLDRRSQTSSAAHRDTLVAFRRELFTVDALPAVDLEELN